MAEAEFGWITRLSPSGREFAERIFKSAESLCSEYLCDLDAKRIEPESKIVQDSLWGFIEFSAAEMILVDSPLVQRLRGVRQLGFAHLLFPNAGYSRFEHSLGVCHVIGEFSKRFENSSPPVSGAQRTEVAKSDIQILRLAALLHDVGHIAFSHVSERCLESYSGFSDFFSEMRSALKKEFQCRQKPAPAELLSVCVCSSPAVRKLIAYGQGLQVDSAIRQICQCIIGATQKESKWFLTEMISGDMDADKLDYIPRDCLATGVPLPFDVKRLILKTRLARGREPESSQVRLAISFTGARALMDLTVSRMMLREKIYRHPKVMAAEAMLENALKAASRAQPDLINPDNLLLMEDEPLMAAITASDGVGSASAKRLISWLKSRRLLKRAFVFSAHFISANTRGEERAAPRPDDKTRLMKFATAEAHQKLLRTQIFEELQRICTLLTLPHLCPSSEDFIAIASAKLTSGAGGAQHQPWVVDAQDTLIDDASSWQHLFSNVEWANAHEAAEALNYVFCPPEVRVHCHIATRNVLANSYGLVFKKPAALLAKLTRSQITEIDRQLLEAQPTPEDRRNYRDLLILSADTGGDAERARLEPLRLDIPPTVERLLQPRHEQVADKLSVTSQFHGPDGHQVSGLRLRIWLAQFPDEFQKDALELFLNTIFLDRGEFVKALRHGLETLQPELASLKVHVSPLTSSGDFMTYFSGDLSLADRLIIKHRSVGEAISAAATDPSSSLLVVDDVLGSGKQASDVLRIWFGELPQREPTSVAAQLSKTDRDWIRRDGRQIVFVFGFALMEGIEMLKADLLKRKIAATISAPHISSIAHGVFGAESSLFIANPERREQFKRLCESFGEQLLQDRADKLGWRPDELRRKALGYSEAGQLLATSYNCPTITLPILWAEGMVNSKEWVPLFRRRFRT